MQCLAGVHERLAWIIVWSYYFQLYLYSVGSQMRFCWLVLEWLAPSTLLQQDHYGWQSKQLANRVSPNAKSQSRGTNMTVAVGSSFWSPSAPQMWKHCRPSSPCSLVLFLPLPILGACSVAGKTASMSTITPSIHYLLPGAEENFYCLLPGPEEELQHGRILACEEGSCISLKGSCGREIIFCRTVILPLGQEEGSKNTTKIQQKLL